MKNVVFWDATPYCSCNNDVSEQCIGSIIRMTRIGEVRKMISVESNRSALRRIRSYEESHGVQSQTTEFFIVTAGETSNLTHERDCSNISFWPPNESILQTTVTLWGDCGKMCEDFALNFGVKTWLLHHDNPPFHTTYFTRELLTINIMTIVLNHPIRLTEHL
jgi:hypothetical protein